LLLLHQEVSKDPSFLALQCHILKYSGWFFCSLHKKIMILKILPCLF